MLHSFYVISIKILLWISLWQPVWIQFLKITQKEKNIFYPNRLFRSKPGLMQSKSRSVLETRLGLNEKIPD